MLLINRFESQNNHPGLFELTCQAAIRVRQDEGYITHCQDNVISHDFTEKILRCEQCASRSIEHRLMTIGDAQFAGPLHYCLFIVVDHDGLGTGWKTAENMEEYGFPASVR